MTDVLTFKKGDTVRFNSPTGSWGVVEGPYQYKDVLGYRIELHFGLSRLLSPIIDKVTARHDDLVPLDPKLFARYVECRAGSSEQRKVFEELKLT